jgi:hypothetical protein
LFSWVFLSKNGYEASTEDALRFGEWCLVMGRFRWIKYQAAGMTSMLNSGAVTMPPTMGAAMRVMTSEPVPCPIRMGNKTRHNHGNSHGLRPHAHDGALANGGQQRSSLSGSPAARCCFQAFCR